MEPKSDKETVETNASQNVTVLPNDRRNFLRRAAIGVAGTAGLVAVGASSVHAEGSAKSKILARIKAQMAQDPIEIEDGGGGGDGQESAATGGGISGQDLKELSTSFKEMLEAVKALASELRLTVVESKKSGTMRNIEETFREASDTYRTLKGELEKAEK